MSPPTHTGLARVLVPAGLLLGVALGVIHVSFGLLASLTVLLWALAGGGLAWLGLAIAQGRLDFRAALAALLRHDR